MLHNVFYMLFFAVQCIQCLLHNMQKAVLNIAIHLAVTLCLQSEKCRVYRKTYACICLNVPELVFTVALGGLLHRLSDAVTLTWYSWPHLSPVTVHSEPVDWQVVEKPLLSCAVAVYCCPPALDVHDTTKAFVEQFTVARTFHGVQGTRIQKARKNVMS